MCLGKRKANSMYHSTDYILKTIQILTPVLRLPYTLLSCMCEYNFRLGSSVCIALYCFLLGGYSASQS